MQLVQASQVSDCSYLQESEIVFAGTTKMGDVAMEGGTPVIVLADTAVAQQVVPPSECTRAAARRILEIANAVEPIQGRIHIEKINEPFLFRDRGSPAEYSAGLKLAIERGWLKMHESGTFVTFSAAGTELFV